MPEARGRATAQHRREPEEMRRIKREAGRQAVEIGQPGEPVHDALAKSVALNLAGWMR